MSVPAGVRLSVLFLAASCLIATDGRSQGFPFSQRGSVSQTIAFTTVTVDYSRPVARGRVLFGDSATVRWNNVWHPGADSATRISLSHDVLLDGRLLKAGTYSLWLIPRESEPWTVILSRASHVYHAPYPGESDDALRVSVAAETGAHMETLAIYFPVVLRDEAVMKVHWGRTAIPIRIKAPYRPALSPAPADTR